MDPGVSFVPAEFWGVKVAPKKSVTVGRTFSANEDELDTYHLSQVALGPNADSGRHVVFIEYEGQKNVIGSLSLGKTEQFQIDFPVNCELTVSHSGKSDVYVTGYTTRQYLSLGTSSDEEGEWESGSDEEPLPLAGKRLPNGPSPAKRMEMRTLQRMAEGSSEEGESDESEEESDDDEGAAAGVGSAAARHVQSQAHQFSDMDDDSDEDGSDEDEGDSEDEDEPTAAAAGARAALGKLFDDQADEDEDESGEEDSDEDEDDDEDEESDEDVELKPAPKVGAKRGAAQATTPQQQQQQQPQKKAKAAADTPGSPGTTAKYQADLVQYLKTNGATKLAVLGSQVKRAPGLPKMKKFLEDRPAVFKLDAQAGLASLA